MNDPAMTETERPVPTSKDIYPAWHARKEQVIKNLVEKRVLAASTSSGVPDLTQEFQNLSTREKADLLYEKLMAYSVATRIMKEEQKQGTSTEPEPIDPYLVGEIRALWQDPKTQELFTDRAAEARIDARLHRASETGRNWKEINSKIADTRKVFEEEARRLFLQQVTRPDQVEAARGRTARFAQELIRLQQEKQDIIWLQDVPHTFENTDVVANIMYETLSKYSDELNQGFVWLPSRLNIHVATVEALQNGRWPVLRGEAGTGKSEQADAAALVLTGEQPTHLAASQNTSERELIADKELDPATGGSYELYGAPMQAATGYEDSRQTEPRFKTGRIVRIDESGRLGDKGYAVIKELRQKRTATPDDIRKFNEGRTIDPDKLLHGKPVLPGYAAIFTTNPEGSRYPNRTEPDAALRRELSYITVDYAEMDITNPELYEFMLAALMDKNHHIAVAKSELEPAYTVVPGNVTLPDGRKIKAEQQLTRSTNNPQHGILYRLAYAIRTLQDSFVVGNQRVPSDAPLNFEPQADGTIKILDTSSGGEPLTLINSTITLGEIASWMKGFNERRLKDDPNYQVSTLTDWIKLKLRTYLHQVDEIDRDKIKAIFEYYHLFDATPDLANATPITPKEIGYLSPRVPRPLHLDFATSTTTGEGTGEVTPPHSLDLHTDFAGYLEDGSRILIKTGVLDFERDGRQILLKNGTLVTLGGEKFRFAGFSPDGKVVVRLANEDLYRILDPEQVKAEGEFNFIMQEAEALFGDDFIGPDQIEKAFGIKIPDAPDIPFTMDELRAANDRDEVLIIYTDKAPDGKPLTMEKMFAFLQPKFDAESKGGTLRTTAWIEDKDDFYKKDTPTLRWRLVSKAGIPNSGDKNYLQQTEVLASYTKDTVFKGHSTPPEFQEALREFERQKGEIARLLGGTTWNQAGEKLEALKLTKLTRLSPVEDAYFSLAYYQNTGERLMSDTVNWTNRRASGGRFVCLGYFLEDGVDVDRWYPGPRNPVGVRALSFASPGSLFLNSWFLSSLPREEGSPQIFQNSKFTQLTKTRSGFAVAA